VIYRLVLYIEENVSRMFASGQDGRGQVLKTIAAAMLAGGHKHAVVVVLHSRGPRDLDILAKHRRHTSTRAKQMTRRYRL
jgi:hypothetical protein